MLMYIVDQLLFRYALNGFLSIGNFSDSEILYLISPIDFHTFCCAFVTAGTTADVATAVAAAINFLSSAIFFLFKLQLIK
jgi:hypothetical protein